MRTYRAGLPGTRTFDQVFKALAGDLGEVGHTVDTGHWQSLSDVPQTKTIELSDVTFQYGIPTEQIHLLADTKASDPWAELQFQERINEVPVNPGDTYHLWPYYRGNVEKHKEQGLFSHTYAERFWPRFKPSTHEGDTGYERRGIRYRYGDLSDVVKLLAAHPHTRQAYLPIFHPEDTGAHHGERIPCSLGYHFMLRRQRLNVVYPIRSCDILRHFRDDVYMACRLAQWVLEQLVPRTGPNDARDFKADHPWAKVVPGALTMHCFSLHAFEPEREMIKRMAQR